MSMDDHGPVSVAAGQLRAIVERIERLAEEKAQIAAQIAEVYAEAKGNGFDVKTLRKVVALRGQTPEARSEAEAMLDLYLGALGMGGTPLAEWADRLTVARFAAAGAKAAAESDAFAKVTALRGVSR
jgi:uncharacterized protein (UPF0335 family)